MNLHISYDYCKKIMEQDYGQYYQSAMKLAENQQQVIWVIFTFRHTLKLLVEGENAKKDFVKFTQEYDWFKRFRVMGNHPIWEALADVMERTDLPYTPFDEMIQGYKQQMFYTRYDTLEELIQNSHQVSGTLSQILLEALSPEQARVLKNSSRKLGTAMKLTSILENIEIDLKKGKIYLPRESMRKHQYSISDLIQNKVTGRFISMWEEMAASVEACLAATSDMIDYYPDELKGLVEELIIACHRKLSDIREQGYHVFRNRVIQV